MSEASQGPIERFVWGVFTVRGKEHGERGDERLGVGKDIRIVDGEVTEWKERKGHELNPDMITGISAAQAEVLILGRGVNGNLQCPVKALEKIPCLGIKDFCVLRTPDACRVYNELHRAGRKVALLAHGTY